VFFQCTLPRRVRVDEGLARSAANAISGSETKTFNNNATKAVCHKDDRPLRCLPMLEPSSISAHALSHICKPSFKAQIRHQLPCVVVEVLAADTVAMRVRIVSPAEDARVSGYRSGGDRGASARRSPPSKSCRGIRIRSSHGRLQCWRMLVRAFRMLRMAYSTTGCSPSATTSRPCAGVSTGSFGLRDT
jgi:hypothetical protein